MERREPKRVTVLGDGGWGTTLAIILNGKGLQVTLWGVFPEYMDYLRRRRENKKFLPGVKIPAGIRLTSDLALAAEDTNLFVVAVPSHHMRGICRNLSKFIAVRKRGRRPLLISGAKGLETGTLMRMSEVIAREIPGVRVAALSGPSHAEEVVRGKPTTVVVSSKSRETSLEAQDLLMTERFRVYTNPDTVGVEIAGAIKNVIAIAAGASDGLGLGDNAKAALITRGIVEIARLGVRMGARARTFAGLAGIGDLITTCVSRYGRNREVGEMIARGKSLAQIVRGMEKIAEGIRTTKAAYSLSRRLGVEMPITEQVYAVLYRGKDPATAVRELMIRSPKSES